jgi:hypothetical protein
MRYLSTAAARGIKRHQQNAMERCKGCIDEQCNLCLAKHLRQVENLLRIGCLGDTPASLQYLYVKETERRQALQCLILTNVLRTQAIGGTMEMLGVVLDRPDVAAYGSWSVVTTLQFLKHDLT